MTHSALRDEYTEETVANPHQHGFDDSGKARGAPGRKAPTPSGRGPLARNRLTHVASGCVMPRAKSIVKVSVTQ